MFESVNPANSKLIKSYPLTSASEAADIIRNMDETWKEWRSISIEERASYMKRLAGLFRQKKESLAVVMTEEMGKLHREGVAEIEKCAWVCEYFATHTAEFLMPTPITADFKESYVSYQPLGIILAIMPWNFPFWQVMRFAAPALMAGNAGLLKHAPNVPGCAKALEDLFTEAGFPKFIFRNIRVEVEDVKQLIADPRVKAVTLTGSTGAGKQVAELAGAHLKKTVLELGGSDPYIVLEDADLEQAAQKCVESRLLNNGQSCIAAKRFIVVEGVYEAFKEKVLALMKNKIMGDPHDPETDIGPMARQDLQQHLHEQVERSVKMGARLILGGQIPQREGYFYPPTILVDIVENSPAYNEELFGPVVSLLKVKDVEEAIRVANDTVYGLGAAIFTEDEVKGKELAEKYLDVGCCFVNDFARSDPRLPFGGIKESGFGRELSLLGIREFVNAKTVAIK